MTNAYIGRLISWTALIISPLCKAAHNGDRRGPTTSPHMIAISTYNRRLRLSVFYLLSDWRGSIVQGRGLDTVSRFARRYRYALWTFALFLHLPLVHARSLLPRNKAFRLWFLCISVSFHRSFYFQMEFKFLRSYFYSNLLSYLYLFGINDQNPSVYIAFIILQLVAQTTSLFQL